MSLTNCTHKLKTLMRSLHPVVAIETVEEARVQTVINSIASELNLPLMEWSITRGLTRPPRELGMNGTQEPSKLLATLYKQPNEGIYLLKDFSKHLTGAFDIRLFREVAQRYAGGRSVLVLGMRTDLLSWLPSRPKPTSCSAFLSSWSVLFSHLCFLSDVLVVFSPFKALHRMLDHRQLGLKLIANVTYGYTSANFSGRMPCIEVKTVLYTCKSRLTTFHLCTPSANYSAKQSYSFCSCKTEDCTMGLQLHACIPFCLTFF